MFQSIFYDLEPFIKIVLTHVWIFLLISSCGVFCNGEKLARIGWIPDKHPEKWLAVLQKASQAQAYWRVKIEVPCVHQFPFSLGGTKSVPCWRALVDSEIPCVLNILELMALDVAHGTMASHADVSVLIQRTWKHIITWKNWIQVAV